MRKYRARRKVGILLPISSLPSSFGIGDLGKNAYKFIDILHQTGAKLWQVLPLTPLGFGNSPYQSSSSFAGDEIYISLDRLVEDGLLDSYETKNFNENSNRIEYDKVRLYKEDLYKKAFKRFVQLKTNEFKSGYQAFIENNAWVFNYAVFKTFSKLNHGRLWNYWPKPYKDWIKNKDLDLSYLQRQIDYQLFLQFIFCRQWFELKAYANQNNIQIMGDLPIYLGLDSADVWQHQDMFLLDKNGNPDFVAGVPPDFFSETGQLWGNPLYNWDNLKKDNFAFWIKRLKGNFKLFDILRIDHFRAFDTYWKIPASETTAINGQWIKAPGYEFFDTVYKEIPKANIIAEDLGDLRPEVHKLRDHYKLKGMKVFQFHFNVKTKGKCFSDKKNVIIYTGTHDNNTLLGWYKEQKKWQKKQLKKYFKANDRNIVSSIIKYVLKDTQAKHVIIPIQDILELDQGARLNTPGTIGSPNWQWKLTDFNSLNSRISWFAQQVTECR